MARDFDLAKLLTNDGLRTTVNLDVNFDANTLFVDASTNRVGIGTNVPATALDVIGDITLSGNTNFADNGKAVFGAGADLQIYHDGSNSFIKDNGTGNLYIDGTNLTIRDSDTAKVAVSVQNNTNAPLVQLRYDNSTKLATTSTGIDVTGGITSTSNITSGNDFFVPNGRYYRFTSAASGSTGGFLFGDTAGTGGSVSFKRNSDSASILIVNGAGGIDVTGKITVDEVSGQALRLERVTSGNNIDVDVYNPITNAGIITRIRTDGDGISNSYGALSFHTTRTPDTLTQRMRIDSQGDISFYEDTGTTQAFFWDASTERLGIGTTSPAHKLHVADPTTPEVIVEDTTNNVKAVLGADNSVGRIGTDTNHDVTFRTNDTERMRIDTVGRVGIGTTSPSAGLHVIKDYSALRIENTTTTSTGGTWMMLLEDDSTANQGAAGHSLLYINSARPASSSTGNLINVVNDGKTNTAFVIKDSGNVGIGTSSPAQIVEVNPGTAADPTIQITNSNADAYRPSLRLDNQATGGRSYRMFTTSTTDGTYGGGKFTIYDDDAGAGRLTIDSSGNVGIGTPAPSANLHLSGVSQSIKLETTNDSSTFLNVRANSGAGGSFYVGQDSSGAGSFGVGAYAGVLWQSGAYPVVFATNNTRRMQVDSSGTISTFHNVLGGYHYYTNSQSIDTDYTAASGYVFEIAGSVNPNSGGSAYVDPFFGHIYLGTGWNGSTTTIYIYHVALQPAARDVFPSGSSASGDALEVCFVSGGTEYTSAPTGSASSYTIRVKALNYNATYGSGFNLHITRKA